MKETFLSILVIAYGTTGIVGILAYWPTIKDLYYYRKKSANIASFVMWVATSGITFLYSLFILSDLLLRIMSGMNFLACVLVLFLSLGLKK